jgi:phosphoglycolate phosphatase-like HAD superfamily hydrolase
MTIKAIIFDFGQTLVDSADVFLRAEKEAPDRLFKDLSLTLKDKFLDNYRRIRKQFQGLSNFSRKSIWLKHHLVK